MIIAIDIETKGLDATKYLTGCLVTEEGEHYTYRDKHKLWKKVLNLGAEAKRAKKLLTVLSHNASFDFYGYANLEEPGIEIHNETPFIATLKTKDYNIKFNDTFGIFRMSLEKAARLIDMRKGDMPKELEENRNYLTEAEMKRIEEYCLQDTIICLQLYKRALQEANKHLKMKQVYTIYQMAISTVMNDLKKMNETESLLYNKKYGCIRKSNHNEFIHGSYRGGRVEAFNTGKNIQDLVYLDVNSLYPYALWSMELPDLRSERAIQQPLNIIEQEELLNYIGVSKCLLLNNTDTLPYLPIRTENETIYPKKGQYFIGTYTHLELREALKRGYQLLDISKSVIWDKGKNHFKPIVEKYYNLRKSADNLQNYFYKQYLNGCIGKFAQKKHTSSICVIDEEQYKNYAKRGYEIVNDYGESLIVRKPKEERKEKRYYAPIISALVTAQARTIMQKLYEQIPQEDLYYTDTDSIVTKSRHKELFDISGKDMGKLKIEQDHISGTIYGKKNYRIGEKIKLSGFNARFVTAEDFEIGLVKNKKMIGIKRAHTITEIGTFEETTVNLNESAERHHESRRTYEEENILIDNDITDITMFVDTLKVILDGNNV